MLGGCSATSDEVTANSNRIIYCTVGKLDYEKLAKAGIDVKLETRLIESAPEELNEAKRKASTSMLSNGIVNVGQAGLSKHEVELLLAQGVAERRPSGFNYRLFIVEKHRDEIRALAEGS